MEKEKIIYKELSYKIVGICFEVFNDLGYGYQEKHYERAMIKCFRRDKIKFSCQIPYKIIFKGEVVGKYFFGF